MGKEFAEKVARVVFWVDLRGGGNEFSRPVIGGFGAQKIWNFLVRAHGGGMVSPVSRF